MINYGGSFMQIVGKNSIGNFLKIFLQICFYFGIILLVILPFLLKMLGFNMGASMFVIYPNGIILLLITRNFIKLFDSLKNNTPFCIENVRILKKTSPRKKVCSLLKSRSCGQSSWPCRSRCAKRNCRFWS